MYAWHRDFCCQQGYNRLISPPPPRHPPGRPQVWMEAAMQGGAGVQPRNYLQHFPEEEACITHFPARPANQLQFVECNASLLASDITRLEIGPAKMEFGALVIGAQVPRPSSARPPPLRPGRPPLPGGVGPCVTVRVQGLDCRDYELPPNCEAPVWCRGGVAVTEVARGR